MTRAIRRRGSRSWPLVTAILTDSIYKKAGYGCDLVKLSYSCRAEDELFVGTNNKPCLSRRSGVLYAARFARSPELAVRVNPSAPPVSVVRDEDQTCLVEHG